MLHAELKPIEKQIKKTLDSRSFDRIQMQIPFNESSIIFLASHTREHSSFWTNCLIELINHDLAAYGGRHLYPKIKDSSKVFQDGLVQLPKLLNYTGHLGRADLPTRCCLRVIYGGGQSDMDAGSLNGLVDSFRQTAEGIKYKDADPDFTAFFGYLEWTCPQVPPGGIVVWHGFHTTKGDKLSITPKATMFLDYAEHGILDSRQTAHYTTLIRSQPFDPGSGTLNARSSRTTIEFNAAKNIPQSVQLPNTRITGGVQQNRQVGNIQINREAVLHQGYGVIVPCRHGTAPPNGCFPWYMSSDELQQYQLLRQNCKFEFERFLTYWVFEREMRFLTYWLLRYSNKRGFAELWNIMEQSVEFFDIESRRFRWPQVVQYIVQQNGQPAAVSELGRLVSSDSKMSKMTEEQIVQYHYNSWVALFLNARFLDVGTRPSQALFPEQSRCWFAMFGGRFENQTMTSTLAAQAILNNKYFMYWRNQMGSQAPHKTQGPAMCVGTSLAEVQSFIRKKVEDGPTAHLHRRMAQGGGKIIAGDSGMGAGTTYTAGSAHLQMQTGAFGSTLALAFYSDPLVVLERFRVKTQASWGAGHVDHNVQSRPKMIQYIRKTEKN